jgi:hypothetical protein
LKKTFILLLFLILLSNIASAQEISIYDFINNVKLSPNSYTIVIGKQMDNNEIKSASELASFLGITRSRFDDEISVKENLIIIGNPSTNKLTHGLLGEWTYGTNKGLVKVVSSNLIIAGSSTEDTQIGIDLIKNYEKNINKLQTNEYISVEFFSPTNPIFIIVLIAGIILSALFIFLVIFELKKKKKLSNPSIDFNQKQFKQTSQQYFEQQPLMRPPIQNSILLSPEEKQVYSYIQRNLARGYQKEDLKKALLSQGWDYQLVEKVFMKF